MAVGQLAMNCFEWQNRASDFLDSELDNSTQLAAQQHLDSCTNCSTRHQHYRLILSSIASQQRVPIPPSLRKAPFSALIPKTDPSVKRSYWERIPWYIRTVLEGASIVSVILVGISVGPKARQLYERSVERSLGEFTESSTGSDGGPAAGAPLARVKSPSNTSGAPSERGDDFSGENEDDVASADDETLEDGDVRVGNSEIWRFNLRTDSPDDLRTEVVRSLTSGELHLPSDLAGIGGLKIPGGIQFDLLVSKSLVPSLKRQLQKIAPKSSTLTADSPTGENFTWYKVKSRRKIPEGKTRVVIWLSQI
jgi:hypothetical protein